MNRLVFLLCVLLISACVGVDDHIPCTSSEGDQGKLCREVKYNHNQPVGQIEVDYPTQNLISKVYSTASGDAVQTITETYQAGKLIATTTEAGDEQRHALFGYNAMDSLDQVQYYTGQVQDSVVRMEYIDGKRSLETNSKGGSRWYTYFDNGTGPLYRITELDTAGQVSHYAQFSYFDTGQTRVEYRLADHTSTGHALYMYHSSGRIETVERIDAQGRTLLLTVYNYNNQGQLATMESTGPGLATSSIYLYHQ